MLQLLFLSHRIFSVAQLIQVFVILSLQKKDHCYLMMRVTDIVTKVLSKLKNQYPSAQEVAFFLTHLNTKLSDCVSIKYCCRSSLIRFPVSQLS